MVSVIRLVSILHFVVLSLAQTNFTYGDFKQNCSIVNDPRGSLCYNGPSFDKLGQIKSCRRKGTIAITFDDGPSNNTEFILDVLKQYNMKATFFIIGKHVKEFPTTFQRIYDEGHQIACHTQRHKSLLNVTAAYVKREIVKWENAVAPFNMTLEKWFRAPHGELDNVSYKAVTDMNYTIVHWGWLNGDSYNVTSQDILNIYYNHLGGLNATGVVPKDLTLITQQHDRKNSTAESFPAIAKYLRTAFGNQVEFTTVSDCMSIPMNSETSQKSSSFENWTFSYLWYYLSMFLIILFM